METRNVKIYGTRNKKVITSNSTTWAGLQEELSSNGISYAGMTATLGKTKVSLMDPSATLPEEDFTLYLLPVKTKSGTNVDAMSYSMLIRTISDIVKTTERGATYFNQDKNFTNKTKVVNQELLKSWFDEYGSNESTPMLVERPNPENKVVAPVEVTIEVTDEAPVEASIKVIVEKEISLFDKLTADLKFYEGIYDDMGNKLTSYLISEIDDLTNAFRDALNNDEFKEISVSGVSIESEDEENWDEEEAEYQELLRNQK